MNLNYKFVLFQNTRYVENSYVSMINYYYKKLSVDHEIALHNCNSDAVFVKLYTKV